MRGPWPTLVLLAACTSGGADALLDRRGFPGDQDAEGVAPPECIAPACWAVDVGRMSLGMAPDGDGGITGITTAWPSGERALQHIDERGAVLDAEVLVQGYPYELDGTGDGGFLLMAPAAVGSVLGESLEGSGSVVLKVASDWTVQWSVAVPTNWPQNVHVHGSPVDGGGLVHHANGGPGGTLDRLDSLTRYDADGEVVWTQAAPSLGDVDLAPNGDWLGMAADGAYLNHEVSAFGAAPTGTVAMGGVMRVDADGALRWSTLISRSEGMAVNLAGVLVAGTTDGGAWLAPSIYEPAGQTSTSRNLWVADTPTDVPESIDYLMGSPVVRLDASGAVAHVEWPVNPSQSPVPNPAFVGPYTTTDVYDLVRAPDDGVFAAGVVLTYMVDPPTSIVPYDGGVSVVGGPTMGQTGAYLARFEPSGRGRWVLGHWVDDESGYGTLATDGSSLFYDAAGPSIEGSDVGEPGPSLLRLPLVE